MQCIEINWKFKSCLDKSKKNYPFHSNICICNLSHWWTNAQIKYPHAKTSLSNQLSYLSLLNTILKVFCCDGQAFLKDNLWSLLIYKILNFLSNHDQLQFYFLINFNVNNFQGNTEKTVSYQSLAKLIWAETLNQY